MGYGISFADRDMAMRYYWGWGIGHTYTQAKQDLNYCADTNEEADNPAAEDEDEGQAGETFGQEFDTIQNSGDDEVVDLDPGSRPPSVTPDSDDTASELGSDCPSGAENEEDEESDEDSGL
jgi:hypothetical protein